MKKEHNKKILIWDLPTRIYHWVQFVLVMLALGTGFFAPEWWLNYHIWLGYSLVFLLIFRLIWGFFGSEYSRFSSFIYSPKTLLAHIRGIIIKKPLHFLGHNPLGALMVFALIIVLALITISGIINLGGVENQGMLAFLIDYSSGEKAGRVHLILAYALVVMIILHILGVIFESKISKYSLVKSMFDGKKPLIGNEKLPKLRQVRSAPAIFSLLIISAIMLGSYYFMSKLPASGFITMAQNETYQSECGDCHIVYHPSLLPKKSWALMMEELENHFGEDASLDEETANLILAYLTSYSAENWDSEAANNFLKIDNKKPFQITATPYWKLRHEKIDEEIFKSKEVRTASNCEACHKDAKSGRFDDQNIKIPKLKQQQL